MDTILEDLLAHGFRLDHETTTNGTPKVRLLNDALECVVSPDFATVEELAAWVEDNVDLL